MVSPLAGKLRGQKGFTGLSAPQSAAVNLPYLGIPDVSPPDQGLAVGPGEPGGPKGPVIVDFVNDALAVYDSAGRTLEGAIPAYQLFGLPATASLSDPRAYWDPKTGRWFLTMFTVAVEDAHGNVTSPSIEYISVSQTTDVFGGYTVFSIDTTDSTQANCPCFGDFDQVGSDANGFYITTNEFGVSSGYNGVVIYAISKAQLATDAVMMTSSPLVHIYRAPTDIFGQTYHVSPASTPVGQAEPGTEYFVETNGDAIYGSHLEVYALLDTAKLNSGERPALVSQVVASQLYSQPPLATQEAGPIPLGVTNGAGEGQLQTDFDAVQEVTYTGGKLYAEFSTSVPYGSQQLSGVDWEVLHPVAGTDAISATVVNEGTVTSRDNLLYPDITVGANGHGYIDFAVAGNTSYPSAGSIAFKGSAGPSGPIHIDARGTQPLDDFTCYAPFSTGQCRYGDYSGGQAYGGRMYMATEYVGPVTRDNYTNWDTYLWSAPAP